MREITYWVAKNVVWPLFMLPALSEWLDQQGWAAPFSSVLSWINRVAIDLMGEAAFPWVAGAMFGLAVGVISHKTWIRVRLAWSKTERFFRKLETLANQILLSIPDYRGLSGSYKEIDPALLARIERLFSELRRYDVAIPNLAGASPREAVNLTGDYVLYIREFFEDRNITELRQRAATMVQQGTG